MKFEFITNACGIFYGSNGTKILTDPWINNGVFEGSWFQYPEIKTKIEDLNKVDAIYLSHIHPDHYDERYFNFSKDIPLIILDEGPNFLKRNLIKQGYENFIMIKNNQTKKFKEFKLTMYKPFTGHIYEESILGNLIDSALVLADKKNVAINFNDNTPNKKACKFLAKKFKKIDLAMINYNAAGPYPSCFNNLTKKQKIKESNRIIERNFNHLLDILPVLKPKGILPFAGSYIIAGKNYYKNDYLGNTTWDTCADYLKKNLKTKSKIICLRENQKLNINTLKINGVYKRVNVKDKKNYLKKIKNIKYEYQLIKKPDSKKLESDVLKAKLKLQDRLKKFRINIKTNVYISLNKYKHIKIINGMNKEMKLYCSMDDRLLRRILDKTSHWNNAEIGTHINFVRKPNTMEPDAHTSLSFFHL